MYRLSQLRRYGGSQSTTQFGSSKRDKEKEMGSASTVSSATSSRPTRTADDSMVKSREGRPDQYTNLTTSDKPSSEVSSSSIVGRDQNSPSTHGRATTELSKVVSSTYSSSDLHSSSNYEKPADLPTFASTHEKTTDEPYFSASIDKSKDEPSCPKDSKKTSQPTYSATIPDIPDTDSSNKCCESDAQESRSSSKNHAKDLIASHVNAYSGLLTPEESFATEPDISHSKSTSEQIVSPMNNTANSSNESRVPTKSPSNVNEFRKCSSPSRNASCGEAVPEISVVADDKKEEEESEEEEEDDLVKEEEEKNSKQNFDTEKIDMDGETCDKEDYNNTISVVVDDKKEEEEHESEEEDDDLAEEMEEKDSKQNFDTEKTDMDDEYDEEDYKKDDSTNGEEDSEDEMEGAVADADQNDSGYDSYEGKKGSSAKNQAKSRLPDHAVQPNSVSPGSSGTTSPTHPSSPSSDDLKDEKSPPQTSLSDDSADIKSNKSSSKDSSPHKKKKPTADPEKPAVVPTPTEVVTNPLLQDAMPKDKPFDFREFLESKKEDFEERWKKPEK
ncbi:RNA polymerase-associated protein LEO1, partial [Hyalella azteca]|uniref:RNA polymerase-associated protein LEO1 n=1 Tax=Hyalella azteca TaxID=294128 RepID=A0A8B7N7Y3_HYAAZ